MLVLAIPFAACGGEQSEEPGGEGRAGSEAAKRDDETLGGSGADAADPELARAHCPAELSNCESADGRVIYVERVDPDGDGDAHFVLASRKGITAPGITVIDVRADLRPRPLPGPGDRISAAGPVFQGSYGQRQIQAEVVNVAR